MTKTLGSEEDGLNLNSDSNIYELHGLTLLLLLSCFSRAVPSRGPFCCEIADLPNGQALARLTVNGRADTEAGPPIPWPPDEKSRLIGKDQDAGKD